MARATMTAATIRRLKELASWGLTRSAIARVSGVRYDTVRYYLVPQYREQRLDANKRHKAKHIRR